MVNDMTAMEMQTDKHVQVMELFGPTIQGEGIMTGTVTHFLRTGGCPLRCTWCDSMFAVDPAQIREHRTLMTTWEIIDALIALPWAPYVTFTGGDPCIQLRLGDIIPALNANGQRVAVETQGMYFPDWLQECDVVTFSPKGPSSGNAVEWSRMADWCISQGRKRPMKICIKVVIFDKHDFDYAMKLYETLPMAYYDAFYFTAGTPLFEEPGPLESIAPEEAEQHARAVERTFDVIQNQRATATLLLEAANRIRYNEKTHVGCQQHVLLWPEQDKGV